MNNDSLFHREALGFVNCEGIAPHLWKLSPSHPGAFLRSCMGQDWDPLRFSLVESRTAIIRELADEGLWKGAHSTRSIDSADEVTTCAVSEAKVVRNVSCEHCLAASNQMDDFAQATKGRR